MRNGNQVHDGREEAERRGKSHETPCNVVVRPVAVKDRDQQEGSGDDVDQRARGNHQDVMHARLLRVSRNDADRASEIDDALRRDAKAPFSFPLPEAERSCVEA